MEEDLSKLSKYYSFSCLHDIKKRHVCRFVRFDGSHYIFTSEGIDVMVHPSFLYYARSFKIDSSMIFSFGEDRNLIPEDNLIEDIRDHKINSILVT